MGSMNSATFDASSTESFMPSINVMAIIIVRNLGLLLVSRASNSESLNRIVECFVEGTKYFRIPSSGECSDHAMVAGI